MKTIEIELSNPLRNDIEPITVQALINHRQSHTSLPIALVNQLQLGQSGQRYIGLSGINEQNIAYFGPLAIRNSNATSFCGCVTDSDSIVLGTAVLDDFLDAKLLTNEHSRQKSSCIKHDSYHAMCRYLILKFRMRNSGWG